MSGTNKTVSPIVIATSVNARYALGGFVSLKSALAHAPASDEAIRVVVLDGGLSKRQWERFSRELEKSPRKIILERLVPDLSSVGSYGDESSPLANRTGQ